MLSQHQGQQGTRGETAIRQLFYGIRWQSWLSDLLPFTTWEEKESMSGAFLPRPFSPYLFNVVNKWQESELSAQGEKNGTDPICSYWHVKTTDHLSASALTFSTRYASCSTACLSGTRLMTQFDLKKNRWNVRQIHTLLRAPQILQSLKMPSIHFPKLHHTSCLPLLFPTLNFFPRKRRWMECLKLQ